MISNMQTKTLDKKEQEKALKEKNNRFKAL